MALMNMMVGGWGEPDLQSNVTSGHTGVSVTLTKLRNRYVVYSFTKCPFQIITLLL